MREQKTDEIKAALAIARRGERGVGVLELIFVAAVVVVVAAFAYIGIDKARDSVRLQNSMRVLAGNVEKARIFAIRRHSSATVEFTGNNTYTVTMDFNGTGNDDTKRTYTLDSNIIITKADGSALTASELPIIDFDWRGRTTQCSTAIRMQNSSGKSSTLSVTSSGDITVDSNLSANINSGTYSNINQSTDISSGATIYGTDVTPVINPCGSTPSGGGGSTPSSPPAGCSTFTANPTAISIRRNYGNSVDITVTTTTQADTIKVIQTDGRTNLSFQPSASQTFAANTPKTFTIQSKNNSKGQFPIKFISACSSSNVVSAVVTVTN
jgi:Tfp pilus assembly protein FimT